MYMSTSELRICDNCVAVATTSTVYGTLTGIREFGNNGVLCDITYKPNPPEILMIFFCPGIQEHVIFSSRCVRHV